MIGELPSFRYLRDPRAPGVSRFREEPAACGLCGERAPGWDGPFDGEARCDAVCARCLVTGKLARYGLRTNRGDPAALRRQLGHLPDAVRTRLVRERTEEVEHRTPPVAVAGERAWPACCGDYASFEGDEGGPARFSCRTCGAAPAPRGADAPPAP